MERVQEIIAVELLLILVFSAFLVVDAVENTGFRAFTGKVVEGVTQESLRLQIESTLPKLSFVNDSSDFNLCLIVNMDSATRYAYEITKLGEATAVANSNDLCQNPSSEDFVVSYVSYDKIKEHIDNPPTLSQLKQTSDGTNFYVLPSKQILEGGAIASPVEFNQKFTPMLEKNLPAEEVQQILSPSTPEQRQASSLASYLIYFVGGIILLVVLIGVLIISKSKKPDVAENLELIAFIKSSMSQGYQQQQIYQSLLQNGWSEEKIQEAFKQANSELSAPKLSS